MFNWRRNIVDAPPPATRIPAKPEDFYLEQGFKLKPLIVGLTFSTGITFDDRGNLFLSEAGYSYGPAYSAGGGRILRYHRGRIEEIASGFRPPLTGLTWSEGYFYVAEGGYPGRILKVSDDGRERIVLVDNLPTCGDHMTGDVILGENNQLYFGVGTATNSGVVGLDNLGWLLVRPECHDIPCRDLILREENYRTINIFTPYQANMVATGGYQPFGEAVTEQELIEGQLKCNGVIYAVKTNGEDLRRVADGFRNPFALGISPEAELYTIDQGYDLRGSRPVNNAPGALWRVDERGWYGWPDYAAGVPITDQFFAPPDGPPLDFLLAEHPEIPVEPTYVFPHGEIPMKFDFSPENYFGRKGEMYIAEYGGAAPHIFVNPLSEEINNNQIISNQRGFRIVRLDISTGEISDFYINKNPGRKGTGIERPIDVKFSPLGNQLYVLDYGYVASNQGGWMSFANSGMLWTIHPA